MTKDEIAKLPTLLDIVNHYLEGERRMEERVKNTVFQGVFPTQAHKGLFEPLTMADGTHILMPLSPAQHSYFRGESSYHEDCRPTLYRKDMDDAAILAERVKRCELERMMMEYPITALFAHSIQAQDPAGDWHQFHFRVGFDGMAQHYGIKTEFLDLTLDPWTAAFFAATKYDDKTDTYSPITDTDRYQYGAFYLYNERPIPFRKSPRIDVVGMQPLSRPGRQSAYVFHMNKGENFNSLAQMDLFRHDATVSKQIFEHANSGNKLFPMELLSYKIRNEIVKGEQFSQWAYDVAKERYYPNTDDKQLKSSLAKNHITISTSNRVWFSDVEKKEALDYWETYQKELFSKIIIRWNYSGPIENVV